MANRGSHLRPHDNPVKPPTSGHKSENLRAVALEPFMQASPRLPDTRTAWDGTEHMSSHKSAESEDKALRRHEPGQPDAGRRESGQLETRQLAALTTQLGDNALAIIGVITTIAGFAGLVTSGQLRKFVHNYSYPICIALIIALLALLVSLNYAQTVRRQRNRLRAAAHRPREPRPSPHDVRLFAAALADLPLDGLVVGWLRRTQAATLSPTGVPADVLTALDRTETRLTGHPVGFDDPAVARALAEFHAAVGSYRAGIESWTLVHHNAAQPGAPQSLLDNGVNPVGGGLAADHARLLAAYDSLLMTAHERGLDI
jgi:hypothetical protein